MTLADLTDNPGALWLIAAAVLALAETVVPGLFLVFLAIAAAITGALTFVTPALGPVGQLAAFALWSVLAVWIGRRWYHDYPVATDDRLLNDRAARMVGQLVRVTEPIAHGHGRVRVGDGEWPATGPDQVAGAKVRIVAVEGGVVRVAAMDDASAG